MKPLNYLLAAMLIAYGCSEKEQVKQAPLIQTGSKDQLNISILIDLSDRIKVNKERDQEVIKSVAKYFKKHIENKNLFLIHDQIKVIFYPEPVNDKINTIAESLDIRLDPKNKEAIKSAWENITDNYSNQLSVLYNFAEEEGNTKGFYGSDLWRFFSDKVYDYCVESKPEYRNILIILTDGYLYHKETQTRENNRTTYLTGPFLGAEGLRNNPDWQKKFEKEGFGFITKRNDLKDLEVMVLEVNPSSAHRNDDEIIRKYWSKWFEEMGVRRYKIITTDLPSRTEELIQTFLKTRHDLL
jgi:hypothetical protein